MASDSSKKRNESLKILEIKRINVNGSYKDRISYTFEGEKDNITINWKKYASDYERKRKARKIVESRVNQNFNREEIEHIRKHKVTSKPLKKERRRGYYYSGIRAFLIVQYKNNTPFFFPVKGGTTSYTISNNIKEGQMLKNLFNVNKQGEYEKFMYWYEQSKSNKDIYIYGGWTYKRVFSPTGSFNGDSEYVDYIQRTFRGNASPSTINRLKNRRERDIVPRLPI